LHCNITWDLSANTLKYIGTYQSSSRGTALSAIMLSLTDLFPKFPLCQACEALFTAPRPADGELSITKQIFQKYIRYKYRTDTEYHYERLRGELEKSVMLGCELCKRVLKDDWNYSHWKHKEQDEVHCEDEASDEADMCFDEGRPDCCPPTSEMVSFQIQCQYWINLKISHSVAGVFIWALRLTLFATEGTLSGILQHHFAKLFFR
jgi:hypothetical protein